MPTPPRLAAVVAAVLLALPAASFAGRLGDAARFAPRAPLVAREVPPYPPLRPIHPGRPSAHARCMAGQRLQGFHGPGAWEQARRHCGHARH